MTTHHYSLERYSGKRSRHHCPNCGLSSPVPDFAVTAIDWENETFTVSHDDTEQTYRLINDNIVNVYNFCGAIALLTSIGLTYEQISKGFAESKIVKTRYEELQAGDVSITMLMAKGQNPIACARCYDYAAKVPSDDKGLLIIVDDLGDNIKNSESTCWLYDCDYSALADPSIKQIIFAGPRCKDQYLRALMAGVDPEKISCMEDHAAAARALDIQTSKHILVLFELYRAGDASTVKQILLERGKKGE